MKHVLKVILLVAFLSNIHTAKTQNLILLHKSVNYYSGTQYTGEDIMAAGVNNDFIYIVEADTADFNNSFRFTNLRKYDLLGNEISKIRLSHISSIGYGLDRESSLIFTDSGRVIFTRYVAAPQQGLITSVFDNQLTRNEFNFTNDYNTQEILHTYSLPNDEYLILEGGNDGSGYSIRIKKFNSSNINTYTNYIRNPIVSQYDYRLLKEINKYRIIGMRDTNTAILVTTDLSTFFDIEPFYFPNSLRPLYGYSLYPLKIENEISMLLVSNVSLTNDSIEYSLIKTDSNNHIIFSRKYKDKGKTTTVHPQFFHQDYILSNGSKTYFKDDGKGLMLYTINKGSTFLDKPYLLNQHSYNPIPENSYFFYGRNYQKIISYNVSYYTVDEKGKYYLFGSLCLSDSGCYNFCLQIPSKSIEVSGKTIKDIDKNCIKNASDIAFRNLTIEAINQDNTFKYYTQSNDSGNYRIFVDSGNTKLKVYPPSDLWNVCQNNISLNIQDTSSQFHLDFIINKAVVCSKLSVSIATDRLRPCFTNTYVVNYCNRGTDDAVGATVQVLFDSAIAVNSASVSYSNIGNLYTFNIGTIKEDSCGQFTIATRLACTTTVGLTHCVTAHIFPDSLCVSADARWNRANVTVDGQCLGDSVRFRLRNAGTGNMTQSKKYYVVEDHVLKVTPQNFILNAGQELQLKYLANGSTIRLVAEQVDFFPYPSNPTAVVENCGGLNPGFVNSFPNNDAADFIAISCTQSVGSFDPNDKNGVPEGVNDQHLIAKNTDIDYKIRFQNTGTDTAYDVYILDTLSSKLNVASLQMGAASHPYRYEVYGDGIAILKVVFPNINLVDSFRNEPLSHGFFTYRIAQDSNVVEGDKILNKAAIYFDYNQPIITNTTLHTITNNFLRVITTVIENKWKATTNVYPNPFSDRCTIEIKTDKNVTGKFRFTLFDLKGQLIQEQFVTDNVELIANELPNNMYLFRIEKDGELISAGKVVKE